MRPAPLRPTAGTRAHAPHHSPSSHTARTSPADKREEERRLVEKQFDEMRIDAWRSGEWNVNLEEDIIDAEGKMVIDPYVVVRPDEITPAK